MKTANNVTYLSKFLRLPKQIGDHALLAAILHDIGKPLLFMKYNSPDYFGLKHNDQLLTMENNALGFNHAEAGAYLLSIWGIPEIIVETVAFHHYPDVCPNQNNTVLAIVHLANQLINTDETALQRCLDLFEKEKDQEIMNYLNDKIGINTLYLKNCFDDLDYHNLISSFILK